MLALIDADIVAHRVGFTTNESTEGIAIARTDEMIDGILNETDATEFTLLLSDKREANFRFQLWPGYKANRLGMPRPVHLEAIKQHLKNEWKAEVVKGMEADDGLGILQDKSGVCSVICTIDKDLQQVPGLHYNFVKKEWATVSPWEGDYWFYRQLLIGDTSDNIKGCKGIGEQKSEKILAGTLHGNREELFLRVWNTFCTQEAGTPEEDLLQHLLLIGRLLRIKQSEGEALWHFPSLIQITE